jgi:hypothetical protein
MICAQVECKVSDELSVNILRGHQRNDGNKMTESAFINCGQRCPFKRTIQYLRTKANEYDRKCFSQATVSQFFKRISSHRDRKGALEQVWAAWNAKHERGAWYGLDGSYEGVYEDLVTLEFCGEVMLKDHEYGMAADFYTAAYTPPSQLRESPRFLRIEIQVEIFADKVPIAEVVARPVSLDYLLSTAVKPDTVRKYLTGVLKTSTETAERAAKERVPPSPPRSIPAEPVFAYVFNSLTDTPLRPVLTHELVFLASFGYARARREVMFPLPHEWPVTTAGGGVVFSFMEATVNEWQRAHSAPVSANTSVASAVESIGTGTTPPHLRCRLY